MNHNTLRTYIKPHCVHISKNFGRFAHILKRDTVRLLLIAIIYRYVVCYKDACHEIS